MVVQMKKYKSLLSLLFLLYVCLSLTGCCGHSSSGGKISPASVTELGKATVNNDGSVSCSYGELSLNALPNTFAGGTTIRFTRIDNGDLLSYLGTGGKSISLDSSVYGVEIDPPQELLGNVATISINIDNYDSTKKYYFAVNRASPALVTSENTSRSLGVRASGKKTFELGFVTSFKYIAMANLNKEVMRSDPAIWCDSSFKDVSSDKYTSNVTIFSEISTEEKIEDLFNGGASYRIAIRTDEDKLKNLSHSDSPISIRTSTNNSALKYGYIDLTNSQSTLIDKNTYQYVALFGSNNKTFQDVPRRVILESLFTTKDNIPISSQEYVEHFKISRRPYPTSFYPGEGDILTNIAQLESIVVNFSEPMNTGSVESAATVETQNKKYSKTDNTNKLTFNWSDNNKKLDIKGKFSFDTATGTFKVRIAKSAMGQSNTNIAKDAYSANAEDVEWNFNFARKDFYVVMVSPKPGDTKVPVNGDNNSIADNGPEITLKFSDSYKYGSLDSEISLKLKNGGTVKFTGRLDDMGDNLYTIVPNKSLGYNQEYVVEVSGSATTFNGDRTLGETYRACFTTKEPFGSGDGTPDSPYLVTSQEELANIGLEGYLNTNKYYKLANDIDYVKPLFSTKSAGAYWQPIGDHDSPFVGHFDGDGHYINNLSVNRTSSNAGLFGKMVNSTVSNLNMDSASVNGKDNVGILVGNSLYSSISKVNITGFDLNVSDEKAGGLVGVANSTQIDNCTLQTSKDVFGTADYCGGIVGVLSAKSKVTNSTFALSNNSKIIGSNCIGGLVGHVDSSEVLKSSFDGIVNASGNEIGGIAGRASNSSIESSSSLNGSISGYSNIGGLCGNLSSNSSLNKCCSTSDVAGSADNIGGLVGRSENSDILNSYNTEINIDNKADCCGGIVGYIKDSTIEYCYSRASVSGNDSVGGLAGMAEGSVTISNSAALNKELTGTNKDNLNKILGNGDPTVNNSYSLESTEINFIGTDSSYKHTANQLLDGQEQKTVSSIFDSIVLDSNVWNTATDDYFPTLK